MKIKTQILELFPLELKENFMKMDKSILEKITEIRFRVNKSLSIELDKEDFFLDKSYKLTHYTNNVFIPSKKLVEGVFLNIVNNSLYAHTKEISRGYIALEGGHRVGITGRVIIENGVIKGMTDISSINIRVAKEIIGCSDELIPYILSGREINNTLIISPPRCGKTTLIRDIARNISNAGKKVSIVDERSEIAACFNGVSQNDLGIKTDVLDSCPKKEGIELLLRSMSPHVIITDEIGNKGDEDTIKQTINAGVAIISTAHGYDAQSCKKDIKKMIDDKLFRLVIVLSAKTRPGIIESIYDTKSRKILYKRGEEYAI